MLYINKEKSLIDKYIEWLVALVVVYASTFTMFIHLMDWAGLTVVSGVIRYTIPLLLLLIILYQKKHEGFKIYNPLFAVFFILYHVYIFAYLTILRRYPLEEMLGVPSDILKCLFFFFVTVLYLLCSKTIAIKFNFKKFLFLSVIVCLIPSVIFILAVGIETIQMGIGRDDENYISTLGLTYSNVPIIVMAVMYYKKIFKNKWLSIFISLSVALVGIYIIILYGKRGPLLWTFVNIAICLFVISIHRMKVIMAMFVVAILIVLSYDVILANIKIISPKAAERIEVSIKEGDTHGRLDTDYADQGIYAVGIENFLESPLVGYYFRLVTSNMSIRGYYAHNIFIEIAMTMGLLGFVPFMILLIMAFRKSLKLFKLKFMRNNISLLILFLCPFLQFQTTGSLLFSYDFWLFFYILCYLDKLYMYNKTVKRKVI